MPTFEKNRNLSSFVLRGKGEYKSLNMFIALHDTFESASTVFPKRKERHIQWRIQSPVKRVKQRPLWK